MARGSESKLTIFKKILETFEGAFPYNDNKEIRIPMKEEGEEIQIKVTLTAAKENVKQGDENALPGIVASNEINFEDKSTTSTIVEPTAEEKQNVSELLKALGL